MSAGQLARHEGAQAAHGGEGIATDFVVVDHDAEAFLERRDQRHHGHRVQFGDGAQQRRGGVELHRAAAEAEHFVEDAQGLGLGVQGGAPSWWRGGRVGRVAAGA